MAKSKQKRNEAMINLGSSRNIIEKQKPILGIDIGSSSIKLVKMKKNHVFYKWALEAVPTGMINQGRIETIEPLTEIIKRALKTYRIKVRDCALYLSGHELIVRELLLPEMSDQQIRDNIKEEIISMMPLDHDEYCIDYKILEYIKSDNEETGQIRVLVGAVPKELVKDYVNMLKMAGLKVNYIDVLPNIAGKLCKLMDANSIIEKKPKNVCMIDFGAKKTEIIILRDGNYHLHKMINYGGEYLTSLISTKSGLDIIDAEEFKQRTNFFISDRDDVVNKQVFEYFEFLMRDFERTFEFYSNRSHDRIEQIYLMGGGALQEGLTEYLEQQLSIKVSLISDIFEEYQNVGAIGRHICAFSHAIGSTFREEWKYEG